MKKSIVKRKFTARDSVYIAMAAALMAVCSWISVPLAIPVTLQTFAVFTSTGLLGKWRATWAVLVYILLGAVGLPVFSNFTGGVGMLFGKTGGYIIGFIFFALVTGFLIERLGKKTPALILAMAVGLFVCYLFGTLWFMAVYAKTTGAVGLFAVLSWCVFPFLIPDAVKIALAVFVIRRFSRYVGD